VIAFTVLVAVKPADTLYQQIHRADIGDQQIKIQIAALFKNLGTDNKVTLGTLALGTELLKKVFLLVRPIYG